MCLVDIRKFGVLRESLIDMWLVRDTLPYTHTHTHTHTQTDRQTDRQTPTNQPNQPTHSLTP